MSVTLPFSHKFCYSSLLLLLLLLSHNSRVFGHGGNTISSDYSLFDKQHDHSDDIELPKDLELPNITADHRESIMLIAGGYRPERNILSKYIVSIRTSRSTAYFGDNHFCAGSIISERLVLTAAHCVVDRRKIVTRPHRLVVVAGAPNRLLKISTTVERRVEEVLPHNQFVRKGVHDIALLVLAKRFPDDNDNIKVIPLVTDFVRPGSVCEIVGWGQIFFRGPYSANALVANVTIFSYEYCRQSYPRSFHESMMCAGRENIWDMDACRGDSGGPLICNGHLAAIISWGSHCGEKGKPTVFTSIRHHREWINFASGGEALTTASVHFLLLITFSLLFSLFCI